MPRRRLAPIAATLLAALTTAAGALAAGPGEHVGAAATKRITPDGVGAVKLGKTYHELRAAGLIGRARAGCVAAGPDARSARLKAPLHGSVDFTLTKPRRAAAVTITGGATARGVGIGDTAADIREAFPKAKFDHGSDDMFGVTIVRVPKRGGGRLGFAVGVDSKRVELIAVPRIQVCE